MGLKNSEQRIEPVANDKWMRPIQDPKIFLIAVVTQMSDRHLSSDAAMPLR